MFPVDTKNNFSCIGEIAAAIPPASLVLKLAITKRAITYFVQSQSHKQIIFFGTHPLSHIENEAALARRMERIFEKDENLQLNFGECLVGIDSAYTLIPSGFYLPGINSDALTVNQKISAQSLDIVFDLDPGLQGKLNSIFQNCRIVHLNSSLLNYLPLYLSGSEKLFLNVDATCFDVLRFKAGGQLQLMNRYEFQTETDFAYFMLLCCDELNIERETTELILAGDVDNQSKIYDMCLQYFKTVSFISQPRDISFSRAFDSFPKHLHFNLYTLSK